MSNTTLDAARFVQVAMDAGHSWSEVLGSPETVAQSLNADIGNDAINHIKFLATDETVRTRNSLSDEAVTFLQKIAVDGRFVDTWKDNKREAAATLGLSLTPETEDELDGLDLDGIFADAVPDGYVACAAVALAVVVGAVVASGREHELPVTDFSERTRL